MKTTLNHPTTRLFLPPHLPINLPPNLAEPPRQCRDLGSQSSNRIGSQVPDVRAPVARIESRSPAAAPRVRPRDRPEQAVPVREVGERQGGDVQLQLPLVGR